VSLKVFDEPWTMPLWCLRQTLKDFVEDKITEPWLSRRNRWATTHKTFVLPIQYLLRETSKDFVKDKITEPWFSECQGKSIEQLLTRFLSFQSTISCEETPKVFVEEENSVNPNFGNGRGEDVLSNYLQDLWASNPLFLARNIRRLCGRQHLWT
jgi:hypothetical protein